MAQTNIELPNDVVLRMAINMLQDINDDDLRAIEINSIADFETGTEHLTIKIDTKLKE